jgi:hypothetical protein
MKLNKTPFIKHRFNTKGKVIAIGDLHGDWDATVNILHRAGVIKQSKNNKFIWSGKDAIVVQLGDQVDGKTRSDNNFNQEGELQIINFLNFLDKKAKLKGGRVLSLIGNHEIMNTQGNFNYSSEENIKSFGGYSNRMNAFAPGGWLSKNLAESRYSILIVNDILFVHGGISSKTLQLFDSISEINYLVKNYLLGNLDPNTNIKLKYLLEDQEGIFWDRSLGGNEINILQIRNILNKYKIKKICIGHTPQERINSIGNGTVWRVDVGLSKAFGNNPIQFKMF